VQLPEQQLPYLVGIAGSPGSGKSTLAQQVAKSITLKAQQQGLSRVATVAPMDGFHYYKRQLDQMPDPQVRGRLGCLGVQQLFLSMHQPAGSSRLWSVNDSTQCVQHTYMALQGYISKQQSGGSSSV